MNARNMPAQHNIPFHLKTSLIVLLMLPLCHHVCQHLLIPVSSIFPCPVFEILPFFSSLPFFSFSCWNQGQLLPEPHKELPCHLSVTPRSATKRRRRRKIIVFLMTKDRKHPEAHTYVSKTGMAEQQGACNLKSQLR